MTPAAIVADLDRRRSTLELEIKSWLDLALASPGGLGLHRKQLGEIQRALDSVMTARKAFVAACQTKPAGAPISDAYIEVLEEIVGAGELWRIYQAGIEQHSVSPFKDFVHQATLIASELVDSVLAAAPPVAPAPAPAMIYLDPALSPAAGGRLTAAADSGFVVRRFRSLRLPVPLVLVPADQSTSFWSLTHLAHEVGHNLDQELGRVEGDSRLTLTRDLRAELNAALTESGVPSSRIRRWARWSDELLADLFGLSLGSAAFASALSTILLPVADASRFARIDGDAEGPSRAPHPPPVLRQRVLRELMQLDASTDMTRMSAAIAEEWSNVAEPAYLAELAPDIPIVARTLWDFPVRKDGRCVRSLAPFTPDARFPQLVDFLAGKTPSRPSATLPDKLPRMHVAFAAELARRAIGGADPQAIHDRALSFARAIPSPQFAAGAQDGLKERGLALRFAPQEESP